MIKLMYAKMIIASANMMTFALPIGGVRVNQSLSTMQTKVTDILDQFYKFIVAVSKYAGILALAVAACGWFFASDSQTNVKIRNWAFRIGLALVIIGFAPTIVDMFQGLAS